MKRHLYLIIALCMFASVFSGCALNNGDNTGNTEAEETVTPGALTPTQTQVTVTPEVAEPTVTPVVFNPDKPLDLYERGSYSIAYVQEDMKTGLIDPAFIETVSTLIPDLNNIMVLVYRGALGIGEEKFKADDGITYYKVTNPKYPDLNAFIAYVNSVCTLAYTDKLISSGHFINIDGCFYVSDLESGTDSNDFYNDRFLILRALTESYAEVQLYAANGYMEHPENKYRRFYILLELEDGVWKVSKTNINN